MTAGSDAPTIRARLWDGPTRIVHWALVALIGFAWWAGETHHMDGRRMAGYGVLHLAAILFYAVYKRSDLVGPMVTGVGKFKGHPDISFAPLWRAILAGGVAALIAWWVSKGGAVVNVLGESDA